VIKTKAKKIYNLYYTDVKCGASCESLASDEPYCKLYETMLVAEDGDLFRCSKCVTENIKEPYFNPFEKTEFNITHETILKSYIGHVTALDVIYNINSHISHTNWGTIEDVKLYENNIVFIINNQDVGDLFYVTDGVTHTTETQSFGFNDDVKPRRVILTFNNLKLEIDIQKVK